MKLRDTTRPLAIAIVIVGLLSFFWPLVKADPPVAGLGRCSCFQIVQRMYNGDLPDPICETCGEPRIRALLALPLTVDLNYVFILVAGLALGMSKPGTPLIWISLLGGYQCLRGWDVALKIEFEETFFGRSGLGHVHYSGLMATHLVVFGLLFLVALDLRDEEHEKQLSEWRRRTERWAAAPREPAKVIDAEIVEEGVPDDRDRREPPKRHY